MSRLPVSACAIHSPCGRKNRDREVLQDPRASGQGDARESTRDPQRERVSVPRYGKFETAERTAMTACRKRCIALRIAAVISKSSERAAGRPNGDARNLHVRFLPPHATSVSTAHEEKTNPALAGFVGYVCGNEITFRPRSSSRTRSCRKSTRQRGTRGTVRRGIFSNPDRSASSARSSHLVRHTTRTTPSPPLP